MYFQKYKNNLIWSAMTHQKLKDKLKVNHLKSRIVLIVRIRTNPLDRFNNWINWFSRINRFNNRINNRFNKRVKNLIGDCLTFVFLKNWNRAGNYTRQFCCRFFWKSGSFCKSESFIFFVAKFDRNVFASKVSVEGEDGIDEDYDWHVDR